MANALLSGNLGANNAQVITDVGNNTMFSAVVTGTFVGTITLQVLYDTAEGWQTATCFTRAGVSASAVLTAPGNRLVNTAGAVAVRALMNPYTSGTAEVTLAGSPAIGAAAGGGGGPVTQSGAPWDVDGDVAHDGIDSGKPVKIGYRAIAHGANPTAVSAADRTDGLANRAGVPWVIGGHPNVQSVRANYTSAQTDTAVVTVAAGLKIVVTGFMITASNANTVNVSVVLGFGTANTPTTTNVIGAHPGIAAGSGFGRGGGSGMIGVGADDADLRITSSVPTGGSIDCCVSFYTIES